VRQQLGISRPQRDEPPSVTKEREPQPVAAEVFGHVAAVDEAQLEEPSCPETPNGQRTDIETSHYPAPDAQVHDHAHPQPHTNVLHAQRPRRQEHQRRMVSRGCSPRRRGTNVEDGLRARAQPDPLRPQPEPGCGAMGRLHPRLSMQGTGESGAGDIDEQRPSPWVSHRDRRGRRATERETQRARAEADAAAGRGTRDGCRGHSDDERCQRASHLPITVNVSVAV
jgi:hypothetical protein